MELSTQRPVDRRTPRRNGDSRCRMADAGRPAPCPEGLERSSHKKHSWRCSTIRAIRMPHSGPRARPRRRAAQRGRRRRRLRGSGAQQEPCLGSRNRLRSAGPRVRHLGRRSLRSRRPLGGNSHRAAIVRARRQAPGIADHILDALATAAGIAPHWFDVNGNRHKVRLTPNALAHGSWPASVIGRGSPREPRIARSRTRASSPSGRNDTPSSWRNDDPPWRPSRRIRAAHRPDNHT